MLIYLCLLAVILGLIALFIPRFVTALYARPRIYTQVEDIPAHRVAIVFGAGLRRDGQPTPVLRDRVAMAAELFFAGKAEKLLMSGDNRTENYNEPQAMKAYALELGIPDDAIVLDYAGRRSYDTCYRAQKIFGVKEAILVTQSFHLPRTLYICNHLGVVGIGVPSDMRQYRRVSLAFWSARELFATLIALVEVHVTHPVPVLGKSEPIFPVEAQ